MYFPKNQWLFLVPLKGGIGRIFHPPEGKDYKWYFSGIFPANWGMENATDPTFYRNQKQPLIFGRFFFSLPKTKTGVFHRGGEKTFKENTSSHSANGLNFRLSGPDHMFSRKNKPFELLSQGLENGWVRLAWKRVTPEKSNLGRLVDSLGDPSSQFSWFRPSDRRFNRVTEPWWPFSCLFLVEFLFGFPKKG